MQLRSWSSVLVPLVLVASACTSGSAETGQPEVAPNAIRAEAGAPLDAAAKAAFDELVAFVDATRGFTFADPPRLRIVAPGEAGFSEPYEEEEWARVDESRYQGLGILDPEHGSDPCLADGSGCDAVGYYDPVPDEMVVSAPADGWGPAVEAIVVHELVHAVQERRGYLSRLDKIWYRDAEAGEAYQALIEGEATLVENLYVDSLSARARWLLWAEQNELVAAAPEEIIPYLDYVGYYPYDEGTLAVTAAFQAGGWDAVDALLADPPATTEALEDPGAATSSYQAMIEMPRLSVGGFELFDTGQWGKNDFDGFLITTLPPEEPTGWGDDRYHVYWDGTTAVTVHLLRGDDAAATDRLADALQTYCRDAGLGEGFVLLGNGEELGFVASLDVAASGRFAAQLAEHGFERTGTC